MLARRGARATVFEADGSVGGIAKTVEFEGYRFDLGGHRFYTKLQPVKRLWEEMLGDELLTRPRMSRIYYRDRFFNYPLGAAGGLSRARDGRVDALRAVVSVTRGGGCGASSRRPSRTGSCGRFGRRLYDAFFRSYTEKVWGIPGSEIQAEWAAQRIQDFSFWQAMLGILGLRRGHAPTLIEQFLYPRLGPGSDVGGVRATGSRSDGIPVVLNRRVVAINHSGGRVESVVVRTNGHVEEHAGRRACSRASRCPS